MTERPSQIPPLAGGVPHAVFWPGLAVFRGRIKTVALPDPDRGIGGTGQPYSASGRALVPARRSPRDAVPAGEDRPATSTCVVPTASVPGGGLVIHGLNLRTTRAAQAGCPSQEFSQAPTYSRIRPRPKFRRSPGHSPFQGISSLNLAGLPSGAPVIFRGVLGQGVAAPGGRFLIVDPSKTMRGEASPR